MAASVGRLAPARRMSGTSRTRFALLAVFASVVLSTLSMTAISVALPSIGADLGLAAGESVMLVSIFQLTVLATLLPFGALGERIGFRNVFLGGMALMAVAAALCSTAQSFGWLLAGRVLQGIGASAVAAVNPALLRMSVPAASFGRVVGTNALVVATTTAVGPSVAAAAISFADWRWLFGLNLPLIALAAGVGWATLPPARGATDRLDGPGAVLIVGTVVLLSFAADAAPSSGFAALALLAAGAGLAVVLVRHQARQPVPMLPLDLLRIRVFRLCMLASVFVFAAQMASLVALPFLFTLGLGMAPFPMGLLMMVTPVAVAAMARVAEHAERRIPSARLCAAGGVVMAAALAVLPLLPAGVPHAAYAVVLAASGIGFGLIQTPNNRSMLMACPRERSGGAGGLQATARLLGQTIGAAAVGAVFRLHPQQAGRSALVALLVAAGFALLSAGCSVLRALAREERPRGSRQEVSTG